MWTKTEQVTTQALVTNDEIDATFHVEPDGLRVLVRVRTDQDRRGAAHDARASDYLTAGERTTLVALLRKIRDGALAAMGYQQT